MVYLQFDSVHRICKNWKIGIGAKEATRQISQVQVVG